MYELTWAEYGMDPITVNKTLTEEIWQLMLDSRNRRLLREIELRDRYREEHKTSGTNEAGKNYMSAEDMRMRMAAAQFGKRAYDALGRSKGFQ